MAEPHSAPAGNRPDQPARRQFLGQAVAAAGTAGLVPLLLLAGFAPGGAASGVLLRPPGARPETAFAAACIRCGLCVRSCPYGTLKLLPTGSSAAGTPHFDARTVPCEMCNDIPCLAACPTGALDPGLTVIEDARMGIAEVVNRENCLSLQGMRCDACYRACPLRDRAITMESRKDDRGRRVFVPTVHSVACTGCGKCEYACVPDVAAIRVVPLAQAKAGPRRGEVPGDPPGRLARAVRRRRIPADRS